MAGYVFAIGGDHNQIQTIRDCVKRGAYSTRLNSLYSAVPFEGTLADYLSMKPGDNIYFFSKRKYYGVGEIIAIGPDCKYCNFPEASAFKSFDYIDIQKDLLIDYGENSQFYRWVCFFRGAPYFFEEGIDTDEILTYKPNAFKILRAFWKVSFIKLGDEENQALREIFLIKRYKETKTKTNIMPECLEAHQVLAGKTLSNYIISPRNMLETCCIGKYVKHEMALEAAVIYDLCHGNIPYLGEWDYVSHQVVASPFKPIDYMDKIDVFAIRYLPDSKIPYKYLVVELKKDYAGKTAVDQVLKYVDWVCSEYAFGNYGMIESCIIAADYEAGVLNYAQDVAQRHFTSGSHPIYNEQWHDLKMCVYSYTDGKIEYTKLSK